MTHIYHRPLKTLQMRLGPNNVISVLKPDLNTEPKALYANLDGEVR